MFENLLYQNTARLLSDDIINKRLPNSLLFSGPASSGKLTCALELARVLSCTGPQKGAWICTCPSCLHQKALNSPNLLLAGPRDCTLEIKAAAQTFLKALDDNASYLTATRYLFIRSIRKLTARFSPVLYKDDDKASKISPLIESIDNDLEELDTTRELGAKDDVKKSVEALLKTCEKLEDSFMYDAIPVSQIRHISSWAHYTTDGMKKVVILENADRMEESARNALLKILEEPPEGTLFILTTERRGAVMQTILSRVRTYTFSDRTASQQQEVLKRVFHVENTEQFSSLNSYLTEFLPVPANEINSLATQFVGQIWRRERPDIEAMIKSCKNFEPRISLKIFFEAIYQNLEALLSRTDENNVAKTSEYVGKLVLSAKKAYESITLYNISPAAALEALYDRVC
ncbi:MAG: DNA polymerase III [Treponema sp.]|nr:DNA polymerase III [Candidatus Treponema caballi]